MNIFQRCFHPETSRTHEYNENISQQELTSHEVALKYG